MLTPAPQGVVKTADTQPLELAQSDVNRLATLGMRDKLYRHNPAPGAQT